MIELTTKEAVLKVLEDTSKSKYWLAGILGRRPIMINNYLKGTRMSESTASIMLEKFSIKITDVYKLSKRRL